MDATFSLGDLAVVPVPVGMPGRNDGIEDRAQDLEKAKALLAEAGFPDGFETTLWHGNNPRPYMPRPRDVGTQISQDLAQVGIKVSVTQMVWGPYLEATQNGEHSMCLLGWSADYGDPDNFLYVLLDKISDGGLDSLSNEEKRRLNELSKRLR